MICEVPIKWGDVATWLSAVATTFAVFAAIGIARYGVESAKRQAEDARRRISVALSTTLHGELVVAAGLIKTTREAISKRAGSATSTLSAIQQSSDRITLESFDVFMNRIDAFEPKLASRLITIFVRVKRLRGMILQPFTDARPIGEADAEFALRSIGGYAAETADMVYAAVDEVAWLAKEHGIDLFGSATLKAAPIQSP